MTLARALLGCSVYGRYSQTDGLKWRERLRHTKLENRILLDHTQLECMALATSTASNDETAWRGGWVH